MQELENILEEIEDLQDISGWDLQTVQGVLDIIRKHMNGGWILVNERLPEVGEYVLGTTKYSEVLIFRYGWNSPHTKKCFYICAGLLRQVLRPGCRYQIRTGRKIVVGSISRTGRPDLCRGLSVGYENRIA